MTAVTGLALLIAGGVQYSSSAAPAPAPQDVDNGTGALIAGGVILCLGVLFAGKYYIINWFSLLQQNVTLVLS